jgi:hypothetical protein
MKVRGDAMKEASTCADERTAPGELMSMVAGGLHGHGFHIVLPGDPDGRALTITNVPGSPPSRLLVDDNGNVEWDYPAPEGGSPDPKRVADIVAMLLTGETGLGKRMARGRRSPSLTFKGIVGLELRERGFNVELAVYRDDAYFSALAEIVVSVPDGDTESEVRVADDGAITWTNDYWHECVVAGRPSGKEAVARDIVDAVSRAVGA